MRTRIGKWGNSLTLRIPGAFAREAELEQGSVVELTVEDDKLVVASVPECAPTLHELLAAISEQNLHGEVDTGPATGNEAW